MTMTDSILPPNLTTMRSHYFRRVRSEAFDAVHKALQKMRVLVPCPELYYPEHEDLFIEAATVNAKHVVYLTNLQSELYALMMATDNFDREERKKEGAG
jgi:hypothetical protein